MCVCDGRQQTAGGSIKVERRLTAAAERVQVQQQVQVTQKQQVVQVQQVKQQVQVQQQQQQEEEQEYGGEEVSLIFLHRK